MIKKPIFQHLLTFTHKQCYTKALQEGFTNMTHVLQNSAVCSRLRTHFRNGRMNLEVSTYKELEKGKISSQVQKQVCSILNVVYNTCFVFFYNKTLQKPSFPFTSSITTILHFHSYALKGLTNLSKDVIRQRISAILFCDSESVIILQRIVYSHMWLWVSLITVRMSQR